MFLESYRENTVYFKQYGEMRTGTNFLKKLLAANFSNVRVFSSEFGWKHGLFEVAPPNHHKDSVDLTFKSHRDWIETMGRGNKEVITDLNLLASNLNYIISIKNFSDWVYSIGKWTFHKKKIDQLPLKNLAQRFIYKYQLWDKHCPNYRVVSYNRLLNAESTVTLLDELATEFNLIKIQNTYDIPIKVVNANSKIIDKSFDPTIYTEKKYLDGTTQEFRKKLSDLEMIVKKYLPPKFQREVN